MSLNYIDFKSLVYSTIEHTDNAMALVHQQREQAGAQYKESIDNISLTSGQMQTLLGKVRDLSVKVAFLLKDDDKKGEKKPQSIHPPISPRRNALKQSYWVKVN